MHHDTAAGMAPDVVQGYLKPMKVPPPPPFLQKSSFRSSFGSLGHLWFYGPHIFSCHRLCFAATGRVLPGPQVSSNRASAMIDVCAEGLRCACVRCGPMNLLTQCYIAASALMTTLGEHAGKGLGPRLTSWLPSIQVKHFLPHSARQSPAVGIMLITKQYLCVCAMCVCKN